MKYQTAGNKSFLFPSFFLLSPLFQIIPVPLSPFHIILPGSDLRTARVCCVFLKHGLFTMMKIESYLSPHLSIFIIINVVFNSMEGLKEEREMKRK